MSLRPLQDWFAFKRFFSLAPHSSDPSATAGFGARILSPLVRVKEKMAKERRVRRAKEKNKRESKDSHSSEKSGKAVTAKTDAPSAGRQAIRQSDAAEKCW